MLTSQNIFTFWENEDSFITGELYVVNNPDEFKWVVDQLDDYEGLNVEAGETPLYRRETVQVFQEGMSSASWIYWYNGSVAQMKEITTGDVLNYLQQQNKP